MVVKDIPSVRARPEVLNVIEDLANIKNLDIEVVFSIFDSAYTKIAENKYPDMDIRALVDRETGAIIVKRYFKVVNQVEDINKEVSKEYADTRYADQNASVGEEVFDTLAPITVDRNQTRVIMGHITSYIKEQEKILEYQEYIEKVGTLVTGVIKRQSDFVYIVDLNGHEAVLGKDKIIPRERLQIGDRVKAVISYVKRDNKMHQIYIDRSSKNFVLELFKSEIIEIYEGRVGIKDIAREPGLRTKIIVYSKDTRLDPVSVCIGFKGSKIQNILSELKGERIDVLPWIGDMSAFIHKAFEPINISSIQVDNEKDNITIVVSQNDLSLAIGKRGQNVRLISQLLDVTMTVISEEEFSKVVQEEQDRNVKNLVDQLDVDDVLAQVLIYEGITTVQNILDCGVSVIQNIKGLSTELAEELISRAVEYDNKYKAEINEQYKSLGVKDSLIDLQFITHEQKVQLAESDIKSKEDLADLSLYELIDILGDELTEKEASKIILKARDL